MSQANPTASDHRLADGPCDQAARAGEPRSRDAGRRAHGRPYGSICAGHALLRTAGEPLPYLLLTTLLVALLMAALAVANYHLAPLRYSAAAHAHAADALAAGEHYAVFDLNLDMRGLRRAHIARLAWRPDVVVLGASHWQEAHADLLPGQTFYNAHVHRDYYEDLLAVVEMLLRHDRLPDTLIMSIRDMIFLPEERRSDTLWLTALADANAMKARLGIARPWLETRPLRRWLGLLSLSTLVDDGLRWLLAPGRPGPVGVRSQAGMDVLLPDGSIRWSSAHHDLFTAERTGAEVEATLAQRRDLALEIDEAAVTALDRLLALLRGRGVRVVMIHPPFNPDFYREVQGTAYGAGLLRVEAITARLATAHGAAVVGSFDPAVAGCTADMFIDAEHSGPACLQRLLDLVPGL
jgi:hypothetical protein